MTRPGKPALPLKDGVAASTVYCPPGPWATAWEFLAQRLPRVADWSQRIRRGEVLDEAGQPITLLTAHPAQRRLFYWRSLDAEPDIPFQAHIVFQDEHLLVADKPHFLPVTPGGAYVQQTLLTRLRRATGLTELSPIHRLDRETTGLVAFSVRREERGAYQNLFRDRLVEKVYDCIAPLDPQQAWPQTLRHRLTEPEGEGFMQMQVVAGPPNAFTEVALLQALPGGWGHYALRPSSGLKHQLRAQMNAIGLPIRGDRIYPVLQPHEAVPDFERPLALLARELAFVDPITGQSRRFHATAHRLTTMLAPT